MSKPPLGILPQEDPDMSSREFVQSMDQLECALGLGFGARDARGSGAWQHWCEEHLNTFLREDSRAELRRCAGTAVAPDGATAKKPQGSWSKWCLRCAERLGGGPW
eukprot:2934139-Pyramimonas_sp.AAC.1